MADVKWIKVTTDIFDDEKILLIESLPEADSIIVIWFKLLCLAGKQNNSGVFMMNDRIPYTDKMLATIFRRKETTVQLALKTFEEFGMVEIINNTITIPNWGKHQNLDQLEAKKEYMKNYMRGYREKQREMLTDGKESKANCKTNSKTNVSEADKEIKREIEGEVEEERDREEDKKEDIVAELVGEWNRTAFRPITRISRESQRYRMAKRRIEEYGIEKVKEALWRANGSDFLRGKSDLGWEMTFDWFVKPSNFIKVLEGNYDNKGGKKAKTFADLYTEEFGDGQGRYSEVIDAS